MKIHPPPPKLGSALKTGSAKRSISLSLWHDHCVFVKYSKLRSFPVAGVPSVTPFALPEDSHLTLRVTIFEKHQLKREGGLFP
jgi:hypothetical protein